LLLQRFQRQLEDPFVFHFFLVCGGGRPVCMENGSSASDSYIAVIEKEETDSTIWGCLSEGSFFTATLFLF
jgi:hypothetical protein